MFTRNNADALPPASFPASSSRWPSSWARWPTPSVTSRSLPEMWRLGSGSRESN